MALILHSSSCLAQKPHHLLLHRPLFLSPPTKPTLLPIKSQDSSTEPPKPTTSSQPSDDTSPILSNKPISSRLGFGSSTSSSSANSSPVTTKKKQSGKRERAPVIRRAPVQKPEFISPENVARTEEQNRSESAFLLTWLGLGGVILVEGILLAASGFLPEEWDRFFVKYLYPAFTPTVFLFVAGTVTYGVLKYLQNEKLNSQK